MPENGNVASTSPSFGDSCRETGGSLRNLVFTQGSVDSPVCEQSDAGIALEALPTLAPASLAAFVRFSAKRFSFAKFIFEMYASYCSCLSAWWALGA